MKSPTPPSIRYRFEKLKRCTCTLYMTEACNLNCIYCYEHIKGKTTMSLEDIQAIAAQTGCTVKLKQNRIGCKKINQE